MDPVRSVAVLLVAAVATTLCACSGWPSRGPATATFRVPRDYEGAYRRVLENARRCWPAATDAGQRAIEGTLDETREAARITLAFRSREGIDRRLRTELKAVDRTTTDVRIEGDDGEARSVAAVRGWLDGTSGECP